MTVFVDTSAIFALLDTDDRHHLVAHDGLAALRRAKEALITSNYVVVETFALVARRLNVEAVRTFQADLVPLLRVHWVDEALHERAVAALLSAGQRDLSLVDCVSFVLMRRLGLDSAFTFDAHFAQQGFQCMP